MQPFWEPILKQKTGLEKLRNSYYAHMQEGKNPFKEFMEDILFETDYPASFGDTLFLVGCALEYCVQVKANFKTDWSTAWKKFQTLTPKYDISAKMTEGEAKEELRRLKHAVVSALVENNLTYED